MRVVYPDDGYYEDMYPEPEEGPILRPQTAIVLEFVSADELDDELVLQEAEKFTQAHPLTQHYTNLAFSMVCTHRWRQNGWGWRKERAVRERGEHICFASSDTTIHCQNHSHFLVSTCRQLQGKRV